MENKFEHNEPEQQNWKKYLQPVNPPIQQPQQNVSQDALCAWVCEQLSYLLDNDGSVRPEQAAGIHGHLALCRHCAQEWEEMQNVVALVENLPPVALPRDFSGLVMQRIEQQNAPFAQHIVSPQTIGKTDAHTQAVASIRVKVAANQTLEQQTLTLHTRETLSTTHTQTRSQLMQRVSAGKRVVRPAGLFPVYRVGAANARRDGRERDYRQRVARTNGGCIAQRSRCHLDIRTDFLRAGAGKRDAQSHLSRDGYNGSGWAGNGRCGLRVRVHVSQQPPPQHTNTVGEWLEASG